MAPLTSLHCKMHMYAGKISLNVRRGPCWCSSVVRNRSMSDLAMHLFAFVVPIVSKNKCIEYMSNFYTATAASSLITQFDQSKKKSIENSLLHWKIESAGKATATSRGTL
jgi:hypothetical protein